MSPPDEPDDQNECACGHWVRKPETVCEECAAELKWQDEQAQRVQIPTVCRYCASPVVLPWRDVCGWHDRAPDYFKGD